MRRNRYLGAASRVCKSVAHVSLFPVGAILAVVIFDSTSVELSGLLPESVLQGAPAWSRSLLQIQAGLSVYQYAVVAFYCMSPYVLLRSFYRCYRLQYDALFVSSFAPLALFFLGIDYARWSALIFVAVLAVILIHLWDGMPPLKQAPSALSKAILLIYMLPLGPIGIDSPFPCRIPFMSSADPARGCAGFPLQSANPATMDESLSGRGTRLAAMLRAETRR
jgi:hypothetical protein